MFFLLLPSLDLDTSLVALKSTKVSLVSWKNYRGEDTDIDNLNIIYMHKNKKEQVSSSVHKYGYWISITALRNKLAYKVRLIRHNSQFFSPHALI